MKYFKIRWPALFLGSGVFLSAGILANGISSSACKTSLRHFSVRLEERFRQGGSDNQPSYESLYQQVSDFLGALETSPTDPGQLDKCENMLKVLHDIVGKNSNTPTLAPMPGKPGRSVTGGRLANPTLETAPKRPLRQSIRYVYDDGAYFERKSFGEDDELIEAVPASPTFLPKTKKHHIKKDTELVD